MFLVIVIAAAALVVIAASAYVLLRDRAELLVDDAAAEIAEAAPEVEAPVEVEPAPGPSFRERLSTARSALGGYLGSVFSRGAIDARTWEDLEEALIRADVGVRTATEIIEAVQARVAETGVEDSAALLALVKQEIASRLRDFDRSLSKAWERPPPSESSRHGRRARATRWCSPRATPSGRPRPSS